jgi:hypothetical protein
MKLGSNLPAGSMGAVFVVVLTLAVGGMVFTRARKESAALSPPARLAYIALNLLWVSFAGLAAYFHTGGAAWFAFACAIVALIVSSIYAGRFHPRK